MLRSEHTYKDVLSTRLRALYDAAQQVRKLHARQQRAQPRRRSVGDAAATVKNPRRNDIERCYELLDLRPLDDPGPIELPEPNPGATQRLTGSLIASVTGSITSSSPPPAAPSSLAPPTDESVAETISFHSDDPDEAAEPNEGEGPTATMSTKSAPTSAPSVVPPTAVNTSMSLAPSALSNASVLSTSSVWSEVYASWEPFYGAGQWTLTPEGRPAASHTFAAAHSSGNKMRTGISFRAEFNALKGEFIPTTATTGAGTAAAGRWPPRNENNRIRLPIKQTLALYARSARSQTSDTEPPPTE